MLSRPRGLLMVCVLAMGAHAGCIRNPATGRLEFNRVSPEQEVALGRELDQQVSAGVGLYPDPALAEYVSKVGGHVASFSDSATETWTFQVLDDPAVNAFALPGGYVYVARGLLAHLQSEAELAATLGHEIGHVAARHGATQYSRAQAAARRVGVLRVLDPRMQHIGALAAGGAQLRLLRHSRAHELEADTLGLRYTRASGYSDGALVDVLALLASLEGASPAPWLSTHPDPDFRVARFERAGIRGTGSGPDPAYLHRLEGLAVGADPRHGFLSGDRFVNSNAGFGVTLPPGWTAEAEDGAVAVTSPDQNVVLVVALWGHATPQQASDAFFGSGGLTVGETEVIMVGGFEAVSTPFLATGEDADLTGVASFAQVGKGVVMFIAFGQRESWSEHGAMAALTFASLGPPATAELGVQPARIQIQSLGEATTLAKLVGTADPRLLARLMSLNRVGADEALPAGRPMKLLVGGLAGP